MESRQESIGLMTMSTQIASKSYAFRFGIPARTTKSTVVRFARLCDAGGSLLACYPVFTPSRLHVHVEYRFYSGLPWFHKIGSMKAVQDFSAQALRDDEWVFTGQSFTDKLWMSADGKLQTGDVPANRSEAIWGVGFFNKQSRDSFMALFLKHESKGIPELKHTGAPELF